MPTYESIQNIFNPNSTPVFTSSACNKGNSYKFPLWATKHTGRGRQLSNALSKSQVLLSNLVRPGRLYLSKPVILETSGIIVAIGFTQRVSLFQTLGRKVFISRTSSWLVIVSTFPKVSDSSWRFLEYQLPQKIFLWFSFSLNFSILLLPCQSKLMSLFLKLLSDSNNLSIL